MRKLKCILCLYLFVAVIMGAVVVAFDNTGSPSVYNESDAEISVTENGVFPETEAVSDEIDEQESVSQNEQKYEEDEYITYPAEEENSVTEKEAEGGQKSENLQAEPEGTASEDVAENEELIFSEEDIPEIDFSAISYHNS